MIENSQSESVLNGVTVSDDGVGLRQYVSYWVKREQVERIEIAFGVRSAHPAVQFLFGALLFVVGLLPIPLVVTWLNEGGTLSGVWILALALMPLGAYLIHGCFSRGYQLVVSTASGTRRFFFAGKPTRANVAEFVAAAEHLGYTADFGASVGEA